MENFFSGIGTEILSIIIGLLVGGTSGGVIGYKIGINKNVQKQEARDNTTQIQIGGNYYGK